MTHAKLRPELIQPRARALCWRLCVGEKTAGLSSCEEVGGRGGGLNPSSTCSQDSGTWCEVSGGRYPIDHIYYIYHSGGLFWQLITEGAGGRKNKAFYSRGRGNSLSVSRVFALLSGSPTSRRREPSRALAPKSCVKTAATADRDSKSSSGKFLKGGEKNINVSSVLSGSGWVCG